MLACETSVSRNKTVIRYIIFESKDSLTLDIKVSK